MPRINLLDWIALFIVILGAFNWGVIGLLDINIVHEVFSTNHLAEKTVYLVQGIAAFYMLYVSFKLAA